MKERTQYTDLERLITHASYIKQTHCRKRQLRSALFMGIGIILMIATTQLHRSNDFLAILLLSLGLILFAGALVCYVKGCHQLAYAPTADALFHGSASYDLACAPILRRLMNDEPDVEDLPTLSANPNGGIQVNYLLSTNHQVLVLHARKFENLMWLPFSDGVYIYTDKEAEKAIEALGIG